MKIASFLLSIVLISTLFACKEQSLTRASIQKDCTGTYIRWNNQDFHVCNTEKTDNIPSGTAVNVNFEKIKVCNGAANDDIVCMMLHQNEGWIEIKQITQ